MNTEAPDAGPIVGSLRSADGSGVVHLEGRYETDDANLWSAITDPVRLAGWYGQVEGDLRPGGEFRLRIESSGWAGSGRVEVCEPSSRILVTTRESDESWQQGRGGEPSEVNIEATVTPAGNATVLVIEVRGLPLEMIAFYGAGWQIHAEHLADYLEGRERTDVEKRFAELVPPYQELATHLID